MRQTHRKPAGRDWLDQIFRSQAALSGGVVKRSKRDIFREVGMDALELEVRRRGFHMVECGQHVVISCSGAALRIVC